MQKLNLLLILALFIISLNIYSSEKPDDFYLQCGENEDVFYKYENTLSIDRKQEAETFGNQYYFDYSTLQFHFFKGTRKLFESVNAKPAINLLKINRETLKVKTKKENAKEWDFLHDCKLISKSEYEEFESLYFSPQEDKRQI